MADKTYTFSCPNDVIECQQSGKCWGWFTSHTYKPFKELIGKDTIYISKIVYSVNTGFSQDTHQIKGVLEAKQNGNWVKIGEFSVIGSDGAKTFTVQPNINASQIRLRATQAQYEYNGTGYIDGSKITIYTPSSSSSGGNGGGDGNNGNSGSGGNSGTNWFDFDWKKYLPYIVLAVGGIAVLYLLFRRR